MPKKLLCFDMDGTIANLYDVPNWLPRLRAEDPTPYLEAQPLWDMQALREVLNVLIGQGWEVRVITWLSKESTPQYKRAVRLAKKEWLRLHQFPSHKNHMVAYGTTKADCIRNEKPEQAILIDDNDTVRKGWRMGGTIDPVTQNLLEELARLAVN